MRHDQVNRALAEEIGWTNIVNSEIGPFGTPPDDSKVFWVTRDGQRIHINYTTDRSAALEALDWWLARGDRHYLIRNDGPYVICELKECFEVSGNDFSIEVVEESLPGALSLAIYRWLKVTGVVK